MRISDWSSDVCSSDLRFIGEVEGHHAEDIDAALSGIHLPRFSLTLSGVGDFGNGRRLRSVWVGVEPSEMLERLQAKVEQAVQRAGQPPEKRKFKPHVTLARLDRKSTRLNSSH